VSRIAPLDSPTHWCQPPLPTHTLLVMPQQLLLSQNHRAVVRGAAQPRTTSAKACAFVRPSSSISLARSSSISLPRSLAPAPFASRLQLFKRCQPNYIMSQPLTTTAATATTVQPDVSIADNRLLEVRAAVPAAPLAPGCNQRRTAHQTAKFPRYDLVKAEHVVPGMRHLLAELNAQLDALEGDVQPTWEAVVEPLERISDLHQRTWGVVQHLKVRRCP
jgi:hypothetical protein